MEDQPRESLVKRTKREVLFRVGWLVATLLLATVRVRTRGFGRLKKLKADGKGGLVLPWHGVTLIPIYYCRHMGLHSIVSVSRDGELQARVLHSRGFRTIRGSSGRHGIRALLESIRAIQSGAVMAITPDGPKGPPRKVQPGTVHLAQRSGCPVLPVGVACSPCKKLSSWDSHLVPMPFSRAMIYFGEPLEIAADEDEVEAAERIERAINAAEAAAHRQLAASGGSTLSLPFILYNLVLLLLSPLIAGFVAYRALVSGKSRKSWKQQIGLSRVPREVADRRPVWVHAVSVGESVASASVVSQLKQSLQDAAVVVSTTTSTGQDMAYKSVREADAIFYFPFDILPAVAGALRRVQPRVFAGTDTEIWPNFLHWARRRGVRTALINGTVSDKTLGGSRRVPWVYRWALSNIDRFCMQSEADAQRVTAMGADPARVVVTGNCKADSNIEPMPEERRAQLRQLFGVADEFPVFVAGSTNPGEDEPVLDAFLAARAAHPNLRLIVAPRQIERRDEVIALASGRGLSCGRRSEPRSVTGTEDVVVLDTFGELADVYAIADVAFVGGSLIPRGCHSILQPISHGKPVFFGPHTFKAKDLVAQAKTFRVGFQVADGAELGIGIVQLLDDRESLEQIRGRCEQMMEANRGASARTAEVLVQLYRESAED